LKLELATDQCPPTSDRRSALLKAEHIARDREPGDGSPQRSIVEQIETALQATE
jgi:hypothetical protein